MRMHSIRPTRPEKGALQVYLDSSDYSDLSESMLDSKHPNARIFQKLCWYVDQGIIEIRFSAVHVIEIAHLDESSRNWALHRARCIQRLTGGKCFRFWSEIPVIECFNLMTNRPIYEDVYVNNGSWHPDFSDVAYAFRRLTIDEFKKVVIDGSLNRKQRKANERIYIRNGHLSAEGIRALQVNRKELLDEVSRQFPLSEKFYKDDLMLKYAAGKVSAEEIIEEISIVFRDIEKFIGWTYDTRDSERKIVSWLRSHGKEMASSIEAQRAKINDAYAEGMITSEQKKTILLSIERMIPDLRSNRLDEVKVSIKDLYPTFRCTGSQWSDVQGSEFGSIPSMDSYIMVYFEHFRRNLKMNRKLKGSDAADLFHLAHLPYCDLFRADSDTAETVKKMAAAYNTRVVSKLRNLPDQIEHVLEMREATIWRIKE